MSEYTNAKNYISGLINSVNGNTNINETEIHLFNSGYLAGTQENSLPNPKLLACLLSDFNSTNENLSNLLESTGIISR